MQFQPFGGLDLIALRQFHDEANRAITLVSTWLKDYRGFRGWTWAAPLSVVWALPPWQSVQPIRSVSLKCGSRTFA